MHPVLSSFLVPCLGLKLAEALVIGHPTATTQQAGEPVSNLSLKTEAETQWNAEDFTPSSAQSTGSVSGLILGANPSVPSLNTTLSTLVRCNGNDFGFDLNVRSCYGILANPMIGMMDATEKIWGPRNVGADKVLPLRYVSRDGTCIVEPFVAPGWPLGRSSSADMVLGAGAVIHDCVDTPTPQGGVSKDFTPSNSLGVYVAKQEPNVRCYGNSRVVGIVNSCYTIFATMPVDEVQRSFGNGGNVPLPWTQRAADGKCYMTLRSSGFVDYTSWLTIWANGVTIANMCAADGKKGVWSAIGTSGRLYLEVGAINPPSIAATS